MPITLRNFSSMHIENTCLYQEKETLRVADNMCAVLSIYCLHTPYNSFYIFVTMLTLSAGRYELALNLLPPTKGELNVEK